MNQITSYLIQTKHIPHESIEYTWNWEVKLAKGTDGKYLAYAQEAIRPTQHTHGWIETGAENLEEAFQYIKNFCENKTG